MVVRVAGAAEPPRSVFEPMRDTPQMPMTRARTRKPATMPSASLDSSLVSGSDGTSGAGASRSPGAPGAEVVSGLSSETLSTARRARLPTRSPTVLMAPATTAPAPATAAPAAATPPLRWSSPSPSATPWTAVSASSSNHAGASPGRGMTRVGSWPSSTSVGTGGSSAVVRSWVWSAAGGADAATGGPGQRPRGRGSRTGGCRPDAPAAPAAPATAAPPARAASPRRARVGSATGSSVAGGSTTTGGGTTGCSSVLGPPGRSTRSNPSAAGGGVGADRVAGRPSTWREGQGATWRAKSPGLVGPWSSLRVSRQMASRSRGTPAAISEGAATPPGTRGAAPSPDPPAPSGHRPVRPAYARATTPTASRRAASSASVPSSPTRTAAVSRPRRRMSPSGVRRTSSGLRSRWCMPR